ncbi:serine hydrolase domain-containing protein [Streptomyces sp. NRRL S-448]|uniref:serine hydrolase domain-containing protein n=1 Tax=Streptomyces sp. NRRL S-448 TaxID=1463907 RepID=UPI003565F8C6
MRRLSVLGLMALLFLGVAPPAEAAEGGFTRVDSYVQSQRDRTRAPGLAYAVVRGEQVIHQRTWGKDGNGAPVTPRTPFLIGSLAKPVTAMAVMRLAEEGRIALDGLVTTHLPWFRPSGAGADGITVRHLLTHTSGISERDGYLRSDRYDNEPGAIGRLARSLAGIRLIETPGARHEYSDANYMLLAAVVEHVAERPFGDHLRETVLEPLGMTGAITDARIAARAGLAPGHRYFFGRPQPYAPPFDTSGVPYGYLGATLDDLGRFTAAQLGAPQTVVSPEGIRQMHAGTAAVRDAHRYGLGWRDDAFDDLGIRTVWHAGATPSYHSIVVLAPERNLAVVVQHNVYGVQSDELLNATAFGALRILLGAEPQPSGADPLLGYLLAGLGVTAVGLGAAVAWSLFRLARPRSARTRSRRRMLLSGVLTASACLLLAAVTYAVLPGQVATDLRQVLLFAPDAGRLMVAVTALALLLAGLRAAATVQMVAAAPAVESDISSGLPRWRRSCPRPLRPAELPPPPHIPGTTRTRRRGPRGHRAPGSYRPRM